MGDLVTKKFILITTGCYAYLSKHLKKPVERVSNFQMFRNFILHSAQVFMLDLEFPSDSAINIRWLLKKVIKRGLISVQDIFQYTSF